MNRRTFLAFASCLTFGLIKLTPAEEVKSDGKPAHLTRLKFKKHKGYCVVQNAAEAMGETPFKQIPHGRCYSWDGIDFRWERQCRAWIDKEDAMWLPVVQERIQSRGFSILVGDREAICWGEVTLTERPSFCASGNSASVSFDIGSCTETKRIEYPNHLGWSFKIDEVRQEVERAFADTIGARPGLEMNFIHKEPS